MYKGLLFFLRFAWQSGKRYVVLLFMAQIVQAAIPMATLVLPKFIIDELMGAQRLDVLARWVGALLGVNLAGGLLLSLLRTTCFQARVGLGSVFVMQVSRKMAEVDFAQLDTQAFLSLKDRAEKFLYGDMHGFSYVLDQAASILGKALVFAGVLAVMATLSPWIVVLFVALVAVSTAVEARAKRRSTALFMQTMEVERQGAYLCDLFNTPAYGKEIRLGGLTDWLMGRLAAHFEESYEAYGRANRYTRRADAVTGLSSFLQQSTAYVYLLREVIAGHIGIGSFSMYVGAVNTFAGALREVLASVVEIQRFAPYYEAVEAYLNLPTAVRDSGHDPLPQGPYTLRLEGVCLRYPGQSADMLHNVNLTLHPGQSLAIVGENGAGKTTLIKLITRMLDPTEGRILLNGIDIRTLAYDAYMGLFAAVFQDFKLFAFSLYENVALADSDAADPAAVQAALVDAGLGPRMAQCPKGIHTPVSRQFDVDGFEPSGGEGQKIALARALYRDAPILLLDEPTAALDPRAEADFYARFDALTQNKTAVYISHRLSSCRFCDTIVVLDGGRIREMGSHVDLMAQDGLYAELFAMQAQRYETNE